jgi:hypothetical protein
MRFWLLEYSPDGLSWLDDGRRYSTAREALDAGGDLPRLGFRIRAFEVSP